MPGGIITYGRVWVLKTTAPGAGQRVPAVGAGSGVLALSDLQIGA